MKIYTPEQSAAIDSLMRAKGVTFDRLRTVLACGILDDVFDEKAVLPGDRNAIRKALGLPDGVPESAMLVVDYGLSFFEMAEAGHYDLVNLDADFPFEGSGIAEFQPRLFDFGRASCEYAKKGMQHWGFMPAAIEHLLSFGASFPNEQRKYQILGAGSVGRIYRKQFVPCLDMIYTYRRLTRLPFSGKQEPYSRFLGVRRIVPRNGSSKVVCR